MVTNSIDLKRIKFSAILDLQELMVKAVKIELVSFEQL